ncbi:maleylpyruvate isomerase N-terminal domain-containing protein [Nocardia thraciensis]
MRHSAVSTALPKIGARIGVTGALTTTADRLPECGSGVIRLTNRGISTGLEFLPFWNITGRRSAHMAMSMTEDQVWEAVAAERASLVELLRPLPGSGWDRPSLCDGWRVRDVVAHLVAPEQLTGTAVAQLLSELAQRR